ncbi:type II secretion system F family protein [Candidatus Laterigemmans baculatus]|uniref:type II secretion system F family protein n=1 Tax=Candidatus Laterigemmans baculatus TaxID=2770505 RepID=UPI00193C744D|nr:type II secretion system F family protein [Candidatus Laterigemmans baculatus]
MLFAMELALNVTTLAPIAAAVCVTIVAFLIATRVSGDDRPRAEARLEELRNPRRRSQAASLDEGAERAKKKSEALAAALERATNPLAATVRPKNEKELGKLRERLMHAGFRRESAPTIFKGVQLILACVGLFIGGVVGLLTVGFETGLLLRVLIGGGVMYFIPELALMMITKRRKEGIFLGLPDSLDLMVVCVEAGLGLDQALRKVADEMKKSYRYIAEEFAVANTQMQLGRSRAEVLQALGYRSGVDDLKQLASILIQADKFGSSVAQALRVQSDSMRVRRRQLAEEKAAKTAVKLIFPLVLFIFPGIFVVLVGPAAITMINNLLTM